MPPAAETSAGVPIAAVAAPAAPPRSLDPIHAQRDRLVAYLRKHGRTSCAELAAACDVPSVTSRVSELVRDGWPIERTREYGPTERGIWRRTTFYELTGPAPQPDLFEAA